MNNIEAVNMVLNEGVKLLRLRKEQTVLNRFNKVAYQYDVKDAFTGRKKGWFYLDSFTASAIKAIYNALNDDNKERIVQMRIDKLADFAFKHVR